MIRHSRRRLTALLAIFVLLTSQLAVSAHVCGFMGSGGAAMQAESTPCPEPGSPNVCEQHCQFEQSSVDQGKPFASTDVTAGPALRIDQPYASLPLVRRSRRDSPPPPEPPPAVRFSVLRI
jgi:hypothetical protein